MVEGARIDHAHHDGFANRALEETIGFEEALAQVIQSLTDSNQLDEVRLKGYFICQFKEQKVSLSMEYYCVLWFKKLKNDKINVR
jgi:hypothetical protein